VARVENDYYNVLLIPIFSILKCETIMPPEGPRPASLIFKNLKKSQHSKPSYIFSSVGVKNSLQQWQ
jgi:hypothetical protein